MCALKLTRVLPKSVDLTYVEATKSSETDIFFGTVTPPSTYDFLLSLNLTEPDILPATNMSFSLGTQYKNWGPDNRSWTQSFHRPLPAYNGVGFHHYLTRLAAASSDLSEVEPYIMSVMAAKFGVFAHPPEGKNIPLKDMEYGYHFAPEEFCGLLRAKLKMTGVVWVKADVENVRRRGGNIDSVTLSIGETLKPDFIIDALGPKSKLTLANSANCSHGRQLKAVSAFEQKETLKGVCRVLTATDYGWQSQTPLQNGTHHLTVFAPESAAEALESQGTRDDEPFCATLGRLATPWTDNCLTLGHGAAILEPLTPAPILLLQKDIERLVELIPVTTEMTVESLEYNRLFTSDYEHSELFHEAFFMSDSVGKTPYLKAALSFDPDERLTRKIRQFKNRGVLVQYDYEPFNDRDWTMLHLGLGRQPERYDPLADHIPDDQLKNRLTQMRGAIEMMAKKMPPHHVYMTGLLKYLKEKHG